MKSMSVTAGKLNQGPDYSLSHIEGHSRSQDSRVTREKVHFPWTSATKSTARSVECSFFVRPSSFKRDSGCEAKMAARKGRFFDPHHLTKKLEGTENSLQV